MDHGAMRTWRTSPHAAPHAVQVPSCLHDHRLVGRVDDGATTGRPVHTPEVLPELWRVLIKALRRPALERRKGHVLRLSTAVRARTRLGEVLLVVLLSEVPQPSVLVVVRGGSDLGGDGTAQLLLVLRLTRQNQR